MVKITPFPKTTQRENSPPYGAITEISANIHFKTHPLSHQNSQIIEFLNEMKQLSPVVDQRLSAPIEDVIFKKDS